MYDEPGMLSQVLSIIANSSANILTINQTIPINGVASLTLSVEIPAALDISLMMTELEHKDGIQYVKILARE
jgi:chorismate mutase